MNKIILIAIALCFITPLVYAVDENTVELKGIIVDNLSVSFENKPNALPDFMVTYTKLSALKPESIASGYSIYIKSDTQKFDLASNPKIETFLKRDDSRLDVRVIVKKTDKGFHLIAIENQKQN